MITVKTKSGVVETLNPARIDTFWEFSPGDGYGVTAMFAGGATTHIPLETRDQEEDLMNKLREALGHSGGQNRTQPATVGVEGKNMLKEVVSDVRDFVRNHRGVIYTVALVALADHFILGGALRTRLQALIEKLLAKAEKSIGNE